MNWFVWPMIVLCAMTSIGFICHKNYDMAWVWFFYGLANFGYLRV